jgi:acyl-CoA synthetase (AMP-forming)/AMP-acid ligase II
VSWGDLDRLARRFVGAYRAAGLRPGDEILIFLRHDPALYGAFFGAMLRGFVPSYMPCSSPRQDRAIYWTSHQALLDRTAPAGIVVDRATLAEMAVAGLRLGSARLFLIEELPEALGEFDPPPGDAIALLQHSSGTTGLKKGVALSYDAIIAQIDAYRRAIDICDQDVIVSWLPLYHDMGLIACAVTPAYLAIPVVHIDPFVWLARPALLFEAMMAHGGTLTWLPNFAFEHLVRTAGRRAADFDLSRVRAFINCSEPCKPLTFDRFAGAFAPSGVRRDQLQCCYAMAETVFAVSQTPMGREPRRLRVDPSSIARGGKPIPVAEGGLDLMETGTPIAGVAVSICDEQHHTLDPGSVGEIAIRAPFLFSGYSRDPARTTERLIDGCYYSRDLGFIFEGHLFVLGRIDDLIIVNGRNLYAHEVEASIAAVDGAKPGRSVAVGLFDERSGSENLIVICERERHSARPPEDISREVVTLIYSLFEVTPRFVHVVPEGWLVKTTSGKISRRENLERFRAETALAGRQ